MTYVLGDTPPFPPKPVHDIPERALVVHPAHVALEVRLDEGQLLAAPDRAEDVKCVVEAVLGHGVVVLIHSIVSASLTLQTRCFRWPHLMGTAWDNLRCNRPQCT